MKQWRKWLVAVLGGMALLAALVIVAPTGSMAREAPSLIPTTIYVDADAWGANDGSSWEDAYTTLQPALDEAALGDEIWVASGTYTPTYEFIPGDPRSATFQLKDGVALYGGFDPSVGDVEFADRNWVANPTILSGERGGATPTDNVYHVFYHPLALALRGAVLDGLVITGGYAHASAHQSGGGMYNEGVVLALRHCTFHGNAANTGGGLANYGASTVTVTDCTFSQNEATTGGGMTNYGGSSGIVTDSRFVGNVASGTGGGMFNDHSSPRVTNCIFAGNTAVSGGGMYNYTSSSTKMINCIFTGNTAYSNGGGLMNYTASYPIVTNCTFSGNSGPNGGAIYDGYSATVVTNSILWGDGPNEIVTAGTPAPTVSYSDVQGGYAGTANIDVDPQFEDPADGDVDLLIGSPCIDVGSNSAHLLPATDFEGDPRIWDGDGDGTATADMGADEYASHTIVVHTDGSGFGTVERIPASTLLAPGTVVTLTATADAGSSFTGWSGDAGGTANPTTVTMDLDKVVTATFTLLEMHTLTIGYAGNGSGLVNLDPPGGVYGEGTIVTLTAVADPGSSFTEWSGDVAGTTNPITLTMDADKAVTAAFTLEKHALTINYAGNGGGLVSLDPPGGLYDYGTEVTLTAVPDPGSVFIGWSGDAGGTTNPIIVTIDADKAVTATFVTHRVYLPLVAK